MEICSENYSFIYEIYNCFLQDPLSINEKWKLFFIEYGLSTDDEFYAIKKQKNFNASNDFDELKKNNNTNDFIILDYIIFIYRNYGFLYSDINPIYEQKDKIENGLFFNKIKKNEKINCNGFLGLKNVLFVDLFKKLHNIYCGKIAIEFCNSSFEKRDFLSIEIEKEFLLNDSLKIYTYSLLLKVKELEQFMHKNFVGAKRFSCEGLECLILGMDRIIYESALYECSDVVIGMSHRGRIVALHEIAGKDLAEIFMEFNETYSPFSDSRIVYGDVKYHNGFFGKKIINNKSINVTILNSPSHLESISGVLIGVTRSKQDTLVKEKKHTVIGVLIHGDASSCGQGVVAEAMAMAELDAYNAMGIVHIVANNQIGFTANKNETCTAHQPTAFAYLSESPVIHVNADSPNDIIKAFFIAVKFRMIFRSDIVVNIVGYRKYGHNESDEPRFTQPLMYKLIDAKASVDELYYKSFVENILDINDAKALKKQYIDSFLKSFDLSKKVNFTKATLTNQWGFVINDNFEKFVSTGFDEELLKKFLLNGSVLPIGFRCIKQIEKFMNTRKSSIDNGINWSNAEFLSIASLLHDGFNVRLVGQDTVRGTFSQRHAIIFDAVSEEKYCPINNIDSINGSFMVYNSILSEYAALGFEYGYSINSYDTLVVWEAQFGDFVNCAQVIIDQYIAASESKWLQLSGIVLLLPHGQEGQGPEHSSARIERFLQLCANNNMCVVNCTTPANYFHILRKQMLSKNRKPTVIFSVKSLLRHKMVISLLSDISGGSIFMPVIVNKSTNPKKVIFCSGKIYYDLIEENHEQLKNIDIIRIEQLYPFPYDFINLSIYNENTVFCWLQEEPKNMGAWFFVKFHIEELFNKFKLNKSLEYFGRHEMSSTASGYMFHYKKTQRVIIKKILER